MMVFRLFVGVWGWACVAARGKRGKVASRERSERRIMFPPMESKMVGELAATYIIAITDSQAKVDFQIFIFCKMFSYVSRPCVLGNELNDSCRIFAESGIPRRPVGRTDVSYA